MRIILTRHGQTDWNLEERLQGQKDIPLNCHGQLQAKFLADCLKDSRITKAFSSSLARAQETTEILLGNRAIRLELVPALQEISHGDWEGCLETEICQRNPHQFHLWKTHPLACHKPNGETLHQLHSRAIPAWQSLMHYCAGACHENILVVTHKFTIQVILCHVCGLDIKHFWDFPQGNCAINIIDYHDGKPQLRTTNLNAWESGLVGI